MKKIIITFSILSLGIACAAEDANRLPVSDDALSSALIPQDKIPHYHGIPDAKNIYKVESQKAIESIKMLINIWKERSEQLTETSFWRFLEGLGKNVVHRIVSYLDRHVAKKIFSPICTLMQS